MSRDLLLPALAGVAAGVVVALVAVAIWIRRQRRSADGIVATAQTEAARLRADGARDGESVALDELLQMRLSERA